MQAIILAAGMGRRLGELTASNTKCMVEVNGVRLIDRMLAQLIAHDIRKIVIVIGYEGEKLKKHIQSTPHPVSEITFVENTVYNKTNNIFSLWLAKDYLVGDDTILLESDLIFEDSVLEAAIKSPYPNCALISKYQTWMDGTMVRIDDNFNIINFIPKKAFKYSDIDFYYKTVNIYKFSREFSEKQYLPFLDAYLNVLGENEYYEQVLRVITLIDGGDLKGLPVSGKKWYEIDDIQDLRIAETIFAEDHNRLTKLQKSFGGYWRYPSLIDFCYLVNPYFPQKRMIDEMKANFEDLLRQYPSGMDINTMLAAKYFGLNQKYVCVGNGAAELIKSLMSLLPGRKGFIYPTFEEYPNRVTDDQREVFVPSNSDFAYSADDLMIRFNDADINTLLVVNPDNPSGNFIPKTDILRLCEWAALRNINIIIDESFVDFSDDFENNSLLQSQILDDFPNLIVVKSISKSYGVPGLRLGICASSNRELIERVIKDVAIWNINSFAEFYMQIFSKYEADYRIACQKFIEERERFFTALQKIPYLRVIPSQANYFLCEIIDKFTAPQLTQLLLNDYNILIKDCTTEAFFVQIKSFVQIAIKTSNENNSLINALQKLEDFN